MCLGGGLTPKKLNKQKDYQAFCDLLTKLKFYRLNVNTDINLPTISQKNKETKEKS